MRQRIFGFVMVLALVGCGGGGGGSSDPTRSFSMGFTPFPYDTDPTTVLMVVDDVYSKLTTDADMVVHHLDEGIPWNAALADDLMTPVSVAFPYSNHIKSDWETRKNKTPSSHKKYVAVTPINLARNALAPWRDTANEQALQPPFDTYASNGDFNASDVKTAYLNYCLRVIEYFQPDYLAIGIEVNLLRRNTDAATWAKYLELQQHVYTNLKSRYPSLPIFVSVSPLEMLSGYVSPPAEFNGDPVGYQNSQIAALSSVLNYSDYYAISLYPYLTSYFASPFPVNMFDQIFALSGKPAVIAETGMLAEDMTAYSINFQGNATRQDDYMKSLLMAADAHNVLFVNWFILQDYDRLCNYYGGCTELQGLWRDTGVYDGAGTTRPSYTTWKSYLNRPLR